MKTIFLLLFIILSSTAIAQLKDSVTGDVFIEVSSEPKMIDPIWKVLEYPPIAKASGIEGQVLLDVFIDSTGTVGKVTVQNTSDTLFNESAITAVKKVRFSPALDLNHKPVSIWWTIPIHYKLGR